MQTTHVRNKLHLCRGKIILFTLLLLVSNGLIAQERHIEIHPSGNDDQFISYGFFLAAHNSTLRVKYSEAFMDPANAGLSNVRAVMPTFSPGFALGFLVTTRLHDQLNLMLTPKVGFYEHKTEVQVFTDASNVAGGVGINTVPLMTEETLVELPVLFKYKSERFNNTRMFFIGGVNGQLRTKNQEEADEDPVVLRGRDLALEMGMGFDLYFKYFKFSPEIRFSHGLTNLYRPGFGDPRVTDSVSDIRRKSITLYLNFQ
ncbi:MAG: PorT family protein [Lunatimonas sp.]|uniref:type IX secretion/gliding motility protein PorT/SprT n=1 Tax=Lunatimonas sp. TaxID=2060141 RepID=UPI00263B7084|nr:outer membrane beta-barrel protein [Lunatimonas sp.]MCC5936706.1 PorT family protein [Lunatimonas sp.]